MSKYKSHCSECGWVGEYGELIEASDGFLDACPECEAETHPDANDLSEDKE